MLESGAVVEASVVSEVVVHLRTGDIVVTTMTDGTFDVKAVTANQSKLNIEDVRMK